jgi:hypothetical protein
MRGEDNIQMDLNQIGCKNGRSMEVLLRSSTRTVSDFDITNAVPTIWDGSWDFRNRKVLPLHVWGDTPVHCMLESCELALTLVT